MRALARVLPRSGGISDTCTWTRACRASGAAGSFPTSRSPLSWPRSLPLPLSALLPPLSCCGLGRLFSGPAFPRRSGRGEQLRSGGLAWFSVWTFVEWLEDFGRGMGSGAEHRWGCCCQRGLRPALPWTRLAQDRESPSQLVWSVGEGGEGWAGGPRHDRLSPALQPLCCSQESRLGRHLGAGGLGRRR